jgi:uncharacterized protein YjbI with pentapeptide repeats
MAFKDSKIKGIISNNTGNGIHSFGSFEYFQYTDANQTDPATGAPLVIDVATRVGFFSSNDSGSNLTEVVLSPTNITISAPNATLSNVTVWSANSILTQSRADSRYQANGNYLAETRLTSIPMSYGNDVFDGLYYTRNRILPFVTGSVSFSGAIVGIPSQTDPCTIEFSPGDVFNRLRFRSYDQSLVFSPNGLYAETGTANWTWSANSILTQGRGDARYQATGNYLTSANLTWSNLTGKPTFANVATSGNYTDLANTPNLSLYLTTANFTYANIGGTIPTATNTTLGAIKVGSNLTIANGVLSANVPAGSGGFQNGDTLYGGTW